MPRSFRSRSIRATSPRRKKVWARTIQTDTNPADVPYFVDLMEDFRTAMGITINLPGFTVGPIKIKIGLRFDIEVVQSQQMGYTVGLVVSDLAGTPPNPQIQPDVDWMWWAWYPLVPPQEQVLVSSTPVAQTVLTSIEIDCNSMRKMEEVGQTLFLVISATGGAIVDAVTTQGSTMVRLP